MGLFDKFKKKPEPDFSEITSMEQAAELAEEGRLSPLYLMPLRFHGEESARNRLFVPQAVVDLKDRYDDMVESLLAAEQVNGYSCTPEYKGSSCVPSKISIVASKDGAPVFSETINIW